jgi:hypothetical protein
MMITGKEIALMIVEVGCECCSVLIKCRLCWRSAHQNTS